MRIRLATGTDLAAVTVCADLAFEIFAFNDRGIGSNSELVRRIRDGLVHLIYNDAEILGYISFSQFSDHLYVDTLAVLPQHRGRGLGCRLLAFVESESVRHGLNSVKLFADEKAGADVDFYRRRGYQETGRCEARDFGRVFFDKTIVPSPIGSKS